MHYNMGRITRYLLVILIIFCLNKLSECNGHRIQCNAREQHQKNCLNGGKCFVMELHPREPYCHCHSKYTGSRCQEVNFFYEASTIPVHKTAMYVVIVGGVVGGFLIGALLTFCIIRWYKRRRQGANKETHNGHVVTYTSVPANATDTVVNNV